MFLCYCWCVRLNISVIHRCCSVYCIFVYVWGIHVFIICLCVSEVFVMFFVIPLRECVIHQSQTLFVLLNHYALLRDIVVAIAQTNQVIKEQSDILDVGDPAVIRNLPKGPAVSWCLHHLCTLGSRYLLLHLTLGSNASPCLPCHCIATVYALVPICIVFWVFSACVC